MGIDAFGTLMSRGDSASPEVFTTIAEVVSISGPGLSRDAIEISNHSSPSQFKQFVAGMKDGGEITLEINYDPAGATHGASSGGLLYDLASGTAAVNYKLTFPDTAATEWILPGLVTGFEPGAPHDDKLSASVTIKVSGAPTLV